MGVKLSIPGSVSFWLSSKSNGLPVLTYTDRAANVSTIYFANDEAT